MSAQEPLLRVVRGTPTPEELAALVGVLAAVRSRPGPRQGPVRASTWAHIARPGATSRTGLPVRPGTDAWRVSGLTR